MIQFRIVSRAALGTFAAASLLAFSAQATAYGAGSTVNLEPSSEQAGIYRRDTGIDQSGDYRQEVQACVSGRSQEPRETCLEEARHALAARRRGELETGNENFLANALARCSPLKGEDRAACEARVKGLGETSGTVAGGGLLRQLEIAVVPPGTGTVRVEPRTDGPVVLVPSDRR